ncbi:putative sulfate transporter [Scheffersomyces xylosifermentans]|uniref:putative sulfate transporter n=1 Tax=Scheffersomyces xylosifermentans TaxID=1304137 RepID=UPI00315D3709
MNTADENTRLLRNTTASPPIPSIRYDTNTPTSSSRLPSRPPLFSIPSTQSLRSLKSINSLNDPLVENYLNANAKITSDDASTIFNFNVFNKVNDNSFDVGAYFAYYLPILSWLPKYNVKESLLGDFLAGLSLSSFQIPLVMSIATSLAHLPPITGLYSIIIGGCTYAILGCVPVLVVGPSPSTAIMYGQTIEAIRHGSSFDNFSQLEISSTMSFALGGVLLASGLFRFGYLDNVLSRALLKGFIAAMGFIMIINELTTEMGLVELSKTQPHVTTLDKLIFVINNWRETHILSVTISAATLTVVMTARYIKDTLVNKYKYRSAIYLPELLLMVIIATYLCYRFEWDQKGVDVVGDITNTNDSFQIINPLKWSKLGLYKHTFSTAFLSTILGYFDSTTATKSLGAKYNYNVSSNRELIALGSTNLLVSLVSGLPSFGAFGRSKINILAGATRPMAGILMAFVTVIAIVYFLPFLYFLPECVLALTTTIIGITVLQEVPHDLMFFWSIKGYDELFTFFFVMGTTILWSAEAGVSLGVLVAVVRVIRHSTRSRIQILGRVPNTNVFRNADALIEESFATFDETTGSLVNTPHNISTENLIGSPPSSPSPDLVSADKLSTLIAEIEQIEGVLLIKIPEPLNFANVGDLKSKLSRIEKYGSLLVHPSQPTKRDFNSNNIKIIIFDCKGMNSIDSSATQVLYETVKKYVEEDEIAVCFSRVHTDKKVRDKFKRSGIQELVNNGFQAYARNRGALTLDVNHTWSASGMGDGFFLSMDSALKSMDIQHV